VNVLVVDDDAEVREVIATGLESYGHAVRSAGSAKQALQLIADARPDAVIIDLSLSDLDGWQLAKRICEVVRDPPRLICLSGMDSAEDLQRSAAAGFERHLTKPVRMSILNKILRGT
jgi:CheY-like chemotaxis protein